MGGGRNGGSRQRTNERTIERAIDERRTNKIKVSAEVCQERGGENEIWGGRDCGATTTNERIRRTTEVTVSAEVCREERRGEGDGGGFGGTTNERTIGERPK